MEYIKPRITARRKYETPKRVRFLDFVETGHSYKETASLAGINRIIAFGWLCQSSPFDRKTSKTNRVDRLYIISNEKIKKIIKWMIDHFNRQTMPLQKIAKIYGIKVYNDTFLTTFARYDYHHHIFDCKPFLFESIKQKRWIFSIANWNRPEEYWYKGIYYDESTILSNIRRRFKIFRKRKERYRLDCIVFSFDLLTIVLLFTL